MKRRTHPCILPAVIIGLSLCAAASPRGVGPAAPPCEIEDLRNLQETFADLAEAVRPSVAAIRTYRAVSFAGEEPGATPVRVADNRGSGVIIRSDGYILTNEHVIAGADKIDVILAGGGYYDGEVIQTDPRSDLAVVKIDARGLPAARFGDLSRVRPGQWTFAMGNPFGLADDGALAFSVGNVTAIGKSLTPELDPTETRYYGNLIQTSSAINPGNSGGPLFNIDGEVIGICTAMLSSSGANEGVGFAIPISKRTRRIIDVLQSGERVRYGFLGVEVVTPTRDQRQLAGLRGQGGALIMGLVESGGPAARAGLQSTDLILAFDGERIASADHLVRLVGATPVGRSVDVLYLRNGVKKRTQVRLAERPILLASAAGGKSLGEPKTLRWLGAVLAELPDKALSAHGVARSEAGLVVFAIDPASKLYKAGLRGGDVIMKYNGKRVRTLPEFQAVDVQAKTRIRLRLMDGKTVRFSR